MKNVCFLNSINFWGGGEKLHLEYATEFQKKQYNVVLLSNKNSPLWNRARSNNIATFPVTISNLSFLNPFTLLTLKRFFKAHKIDTVIVSNAQDAKAASIAAKMAGVKNIVYYRSIAAPVKGSIINRVIFKSVITHIISNSDETKRMILQNLGKYLPEDRVKTIYYGVDLSKFSNTQTGRLKEIEDKEHGVILGNAGRLTEQKGQRYLIDLAKRLKAKNIDFTLFIAGEGELKEELQKLVIQHQLQDNVILLGFVKDLELFMSSIDIFVLSSMWEGFGYVLVEAMLKSKPVVAFNMTSNPEVVADNETGFLVDFPDVDQFAAKTELLISDTTLRTEMGKAGLERAKAHFVLEDRVTELEQYIIG